VIQVFSQKAPPIRPLVKVNTFVLSEVITRLFPDYRLSISGVPRFAIEGDGLQEADLKEYSLSN